MSVPPAAREDRSTGGKPSRWLVAAPALVLFAVYCTLSLGRHARFRTTAYDLGIFTQAVRGYAEHGVPVSEIKGPGFNLLGDHFHPILALLAPFYWLWPDARCLLVAQAVLVAVSVIPITRFAVARLGRRAGLAVAVAYGLSWGLAEAIGFDFHEVAFAVPLLAFGMVALAEQRWAYAACWALPLLAVKEDMGLTVAAFGGYLIAKRQTRLGAALVAVGIAAVVLSVKVLIPAVNPAGRYPYADSTFHGMSGLTDLVRSFTDHPAKLGLVGLLLAVTGFAAARSSLLLIAVPSLAVRLASTHAAYWALKGVHYNATLMPIVFVAFIAAIGALRSSRRAALRGYGAALPWAAVAVAVALVPRFSLHDLLRPAFYRDTPHVAAARQILGAIPDGASVAASTTLAPQLVHRADVVVFPTPSTRPVQWVVLDLTRRYPVPRTIAQQDAGIAQLPALGFAQVAERDGVVLYRKR